MMSRSVNSPISSSRDQRRDVGLGQLRSQLGQADLVPHHVGREPELLQQLDGGRIALGVDPRAVQRVLALDELEEARGLGERRRTDPFDFHQLLAAGNGPCSLRKSTIRRAVNWLRPETCRSNETLAVFRSTPTKLTQLEMTDSSVSLSCLGLTSCW